MTFLCKAFKKGSTCIIPTISSMKNEKIFTKFQPKTFNYTHTIPYSRTLANDDNSLDYLEKLNSPLIKLELDISPQFERFFKIIKKLRAKNLLYIRVLSQQYIHLEKLVEKQKEFNNFIVTIENDNLTENQLLELYDFVNEPIDIGMSMSNVKNFPPLNDESSLRRYFKAMFQYRD